MIAYASRTGTRRNLATLRAHGWRLLVSAAAPHRIEGFPYGLDNGAWTAHQAGLPLLDVERFEAAVDRLGYEADWVVCPDVVGDARRTLELATEWLPRLPHRRAQRVLVAVQDGMTPSDLDELVARFRWRVGGIFLGGSTAWKLRHLRTWGRWCQATSRYYHVARVNSAKRIHAAAEAGAHSFDGTSASRFSLTVPRLDAARRMGTLEHGEAQLGRVLDFGAEVDAVRAMLPRTRDDRVIQVHAGALRILLEQATTMGQQTECGADRKQQTETEDEDFG